MDTVPTCRACLKTSLNYIDIDTPFEQNILAIPLDSLPSTFTTYMDCFRACTEVGVADREEEMPQSLCEECGFELTIAWNFRYKAVNADKILKNAIRNPDIKDRGNVLIDVDVNEALTEIAIVEHIKGTPIVKKKEKNNEICSNQEDTEDIIVEGCENEVFEEVPINRSSADLSQIIKGTQEPYTITNNGSYELIEAEEYEIIKLVEIGMDNIAKTNDDFVENGEKNPNEDNIGNAIDKKTEPNSIFNCSTCFQSFQTRRRFLHHLETHTATDDKVHICKICNLSITKGETIRKHMRSTHSAIIQCSQCDYRCKELKMEEHVIRAHDASKSFSCNICDKYFISHTLLNTHLKYHQRKEANIKSDACEICCKRFSTQHYLRLHMEVHRNDRQLHQCDYCDKIYVSKIALENHIRIHRGETINCDQCGKQFVRQYELNVHMRFHTRDYPFKCEVCGKKFAIKGHLRTHMWRHQGLKLQCEECGKLFTSTKALQEHSFVHSEMPFPCSYCGRGYPSKQKFKVHLKATHLIELTEEELSKITKLQPPRPLQRKKLTLVQADSVMKEIEVKDSGEEIENDGEDILVELY